MAFVLFTAAQRHDGADLYARRIADVLGATALPIAGAAPDSDVAFAGAWQMLDANTRPLIAAETLAAFAPLAAELAERRAVILIDEPPERIADAADACVILTSTEQAADATALSSAIPREPIRVVEPPTPEFPRALSSSASETMILVPGGAGRDPRHEVLFRALARLLDLEWRVCIAGATPEDPRNETPSRLAAEFGFLSRVRLESDPGWFENDALWRQSDLFATAAVARGYGFATAQAMKRGIPAVIAGDAKSAPVIAAEAGAVAPPGDHAQLAKALRRLIFDRDLRAQMAEAAWQVGQRLPTARDVQQRLAPILG